MPEAFQEKPWLANSFVLNQEILYMKRIILTAVILFPLFSFAQTLFRSGVFLTHSTGQNIWGPNGSPTSIPQEIQVYNTNHGYTGSQAVSMVRQSWPLNPWENEWERWHRIFDGEDPAANITPILTNNKIVVVKSCFPSSAMTGWGQPSDTLNRTVKSVYNYKWHWRSIVSVMAQHPENFFAIWTNAPLNQANTNPNAAMLAKSFCTWAKDTLAQGLDPVMGAMPPNVYVFNYFAKLTDANGYQMSQYAVSNTDSHPNAAATALVAPQFVSEIFGAAIAYEQGAAVLSVMPASQQVTSQAGTAEFTVTTTLGWTAQSNAGWCTVTPSGSGSGILNAQYAENTEVSQRSALITVSSPGIADQTVTLTQQGAAVVLNVTPQSQQVESGSGTAEFNVVSNTSWNAQSDAGWCTVTPAGSGNGMLVAECEANGGSSPRTATISVNAEGADPEIVTVVQAGASAVLSVSPVEQFVTSEAGTAEFSVTSNTVWTAVSNAEWCTVTPEGSGSAALLAEYYANSVNTSRTATITISAAGAPDQQVLLVQEAAAATLAVMPEMQQVSPDAGSVVFSVFSNTSWNAVCNATWCNAEASGEGEGQISAVYEANPSEDDRIAVITVSTLNGGPSAEVLLLQEGLVTNVEIIQAGAFTVFPNPSGGQVRISGLSLAGGKTRWLLADQAGRLVKSGEAVLQNEMFFDLGKPAQGRYFLILKSDSGTQWASLIIN